MQKDKSQKYRIHPGVSPMRILLQTSGTNVWDTHLWTSLLQPGTMISEPS